MIPGAWEARPRSHAAVVDSSSSPDRPLSSVAVGSADRRGSRWGRDTQRRELATWLEISIFGALLVATMVLAMWGSHFPS
jgi:hypothetical protein